MQTSQSIVPSTSQALQTVASGQFPVSSMQDARLMQSYALGSNMQRKRQGLMRDMDEVDVRDTMPPAPPPGAGIGQGATPESAHSAQGLSPLQPIPVSPQTPDTIRRVIVQLKSAFEISEQDEGHLGWLMQTGLVRDVDAIAVCDSMGLTKRASTQSQ